MGGCPAGSCGGVGPILMHKLFLSFLKQSLSQLRKTFRIGIAPGAAGVGGAAA